MNTLENTLRETANEMNAIDLACEHTDLNVGHARMTGGLVATYHNRVLAYWESPDEVVAWALRQAEGLEDGEDVCHLCAILDALGVCYC